MARDAAARRGAGGNAEPDAAAAPDVGGVPAAAFGALVAALTNAITAAVNAATAAPIPAAADAATKKSKISTAINPYDTESMNLSTKEGKHHWQMVTQKEDGWKPVSLTTENSEVLADLFKDRAGQFGLDPIINVPTSGTGALEAAPRSIEGKEYHNVNLKDYINILKEPHKLTLDDVRKFSAWIMGDENSSLSIPAAADMVIKAIDPNKPGNVGLTNKRRILLRQYSGMLNFIIKNHLQRTSYTSLNPKSSIFEYKDEVSGRRYSCGLIKLKLVFEIINPQLVVDHAIKEQELEALSLVGCGNNVHTLLTSLQEKRNEINAALPDNEEYPARRFNTTMFAQLEKSTCDDFLTEVKSSKSRWIRSPETFNSANEIGDLVKLYTNFASNGDWSRSQDRHTKMVAMATELYKEQQKNRSRDPLKSRIPKKARVGEKTNGSGIEQWKFKKEGKSKSVAGSKYVWCQHHGHKDETGKQSGMYMLEPHDHADWVKKKEEKLQNWKAKRAAGAASKGGGGGSAVQATQAKSPGKLALAKSYRQALTTKIGLSDVEAEHIMEEVMKNEGGDEKGKD
jgi:hypothetical protein